MVGSAFRPPVLRPRHNFLGSARRRRLCLEYLETRLALTALEFVEQEIPRSSGGDEVYAADLDGDGDLDILAVSAELGLVTWHENLDGAGSFGGPIVITRHAQGPSSVHAADLDGDGDLDVLTASRWDDRIAWHENTNGRGNFGPQLVISYDALGARSVRAADLDGDGDPDVLAASAGDGTIAWYENIGGARMFGPKRVITTEAAGARSVRAADLDGDGDLDVLSASADDDKIAWYENIDGAGRFAEQIVITTSADEARSVHAADVDGDGDLDVLSASYRDHKIAWYQNKDGAGTFGPQRVITSQACGARSVYTADLDGDGDQDVLSASEDKAVLWQENTDGLGTFGPEQPVVINSDAASAVFAADLDMDQNVDVLASSPLVRSPLRRVDSIGWYRNLGVVARAAEPGDANRDGRFDRLDIVQVLQAGKYLSGEEATWGEGDFTNDGKFNQQDLVAALASGQWWPPVDDHGESASDATSVGQFGVALGNIERCGDRDWFQFDVVAGTTYEFRVELRTLDDSVLRLLGPDGTSQLAFNDDDQWRRSSRIEWTASTSGRVFLEVSRFNDMRTGSYTLIAGRVPRPGAKLTVEIPIGIMSEHDGTQLATVTRTTPPINSLSVSLKSSNTNAATVPLLVTIPQGETSATFAISPVNDSLVDGSQGVTISASAADHFSGAGSLWVLDDDAPSAPTPDHGDSAAIATRVKNPSTIRGTIDVRGDRDWFQFRAEAGTVYLFRRGQGTLRNVVFRLFAPDGTTRLVPRDDPGGTGGARIEWTAPSSGDFFLEVGARGDNDTGTYIVTLSEDDSGPLDDHGDNASEATAIAGATFVNGNIGRNDDRDWFQFSAVPGTLYRLGIISQALPDLVLRLVGSDGTTELQRNDELGAGPNRNIEWLATDSGTYYLEVAAAGEFLTGLYALTIRRVPALTLTILEPRISENGGFALAELRRPVASTSRLLVNLDSSDPSEASVPPTVTFQPGSTTATFRIDAVDDTQSDGPQGVTITAVAANSKTIARIVFVIDDEDGVQLAEDRGDAADAAFALSVPSSVEANIDRGGDRDWYQFEAVAGTSYLFQVDIRSLRDSFLRLVGPDGMTELANNDDFDHGFGSRIEWVAPSDGTFFLEVSGLGSHHTGTYFVTIIIREEPQPE